MNVDSLAGLGEKYGEMLSYERAQEMNEVGDDNQTEVDGLSRQQEGAKIKTKGEIVPAEVIRVVDLVSYQEGSVVTSRRMVLPWWTLP